MEMDPALLPWRSGASLILGSSAVAGNGRGICTSFALLPLCDMQLSLPESLSYSVATYEHKLPLVSSSPPFRRLSYSKKLQNPSAQHRYGTEWAGAHRLSPVCGMGRPISATWSSHACSRPC